MDAVVVGEGAEERGEEEEGLGVEVEDVDEGGDEEEEGRVCAREGKERFDGGGDAV